METIMYTIQRPKYRNMRQKYRQNYICVSYLWLCIGPALKCGFVYQWDFIGNTKFSFMSGCQLEMASWLVLGYHVHAPFRAGTISSWNLCRACAFCLRLWKSPCVSVLLCMEHVDFLMSYIPSGSYNLSASSW